MITDALTDTHKCCECIPVNQNPFQYFVYCVIVKTQESMKIKM